MTRIESSWRKTGASRCAVLVASLLLVATWIAVPSASAAAAPFQRGDLFLIQSGGVAEYSPSGVLQQVLPDSSAATALCFDPSGRYLIVPGVGLFDNSGNLLPSQWASVTANYSCVADGSGDVYVSTSGPLGPSQPYWIVTEYTITGYPIQTFDLEGAGGRVGFEMDLAPDECTLDYANWSYIDGTFDVCTNTQISGSSVFPVPTGTDDLHILPNWQILTADDAYVALGATLRGTTFYRPPTIDAPQFFDIGPIRSVALDPDGTSFWACCDQLDAGMNAPWELMRFDMTTDSFLTQFPVARPRPFADSVAVYGPPLLGDADIGRTVAPDPPGTAEAFATQVRYSDQLTRLHLYVDSSSTASQVEIGVYSDKHDRPNKLLEQATLTNMMAGSWNYVDVPPVSVTAGQRYWLAVLGPYDSASASFRDTTGGQTSETSARHKLTTLPSQWSGAATSTSALLSAYGS
jgi:hypothetical protein